MPDNTTFITHTQKWLSTVIIDHTLCPFAKREYDNDRIHYAVIKATDLENQLEQIILVCESMDEDANRETSLLIFPTGLSEFLDFLDLLALANKLFKDLDYEGVYQLASFHPDYQFDGAGPNDPSNYTNRSPYPMLHILRETSVEAALKNYPSPEKIPERNIQLTQDLGLKVMSALLADCYK